MSCECIPPPPDFDLPPPPDPSLIWDLLVESGEPLELFHKAQLQTCVHNPIFGILNGDNVYIPALLCLCFVILTVGCLVSACVYRKRRTRSKCSNSVNTSKTNSASVDTMCTSGAHWSYEDCLQIGQTMPVGGFGSSANGAACQLMSPSKIFGSASAANIFQAQSIVTANGSQGALIRTLPKPACTVQQPAVNRAIANINGGTSIRLHQAHFPPQCCMAHVPIHFHHPVQLNGSTSGGYCTLSSHQPQYEEIETLTLPAPFHLNPQQEAPHYAANSICCGHTNTVGSAADSRLLQRHDSDTIFEDLSENLRLQKERRPRKPPPNTRPPAVPKQRNSNSSFSDELADYCVREKESGYGTTDSKARGHQNLSAWHSPPQVIRLNSNARSPLQSSSSCHSSEHNSPPSTSASQMTNASVSSRNMIHAKPSNNSSAQQNMTYV
ncbi:hypothetical protein M3Y98_00190700 [Aphelenchoides besseyi]|nr:hypothetical protein M3Y98_00190700 [Aphelenchoides besseyi]KAI6200208.1 hypothetical protein M3Y96_00708600 [Aphelenchoides besseyi]